jgi:hypothetical protein
MLGSMARRAAFLVMRPNVTLPAGHGSGADASLLRADVFDLHDQPPGVTIEKVSDYTGEGTVVTLEELQRQAAQAQRDWEWLDRDVDDAEDAVLRAREEGDTAVEQRWRERAAQLQAAADRAWDRAQEAEEAVAEAEYEAEYPEEAAAERARAAERAAAAPSLHEWCDILLRDGKITAASYSRLTGTSPR